MELIFSLIFVLFFAWLIEKANGVIKYKICSVCAGVSMTWMLIALGILTGYLNPETYKLILATMIGGTGVGAGYQGEKTFGLTGAKSLRFKLFSSLSGFALAYLNFHFISWILLAADAVVLVTIGYLYFVFPYRKISGAGEDKKKYIEEKLKDCC
ncbi:MAG: hypothetical protein A2651_02150 [Candidatus Yanofskybacteria bacterium RIFCSPHIGHO2_01_FULL_42_12]|uniref:Uncharacterized protein n=1 Tax=Candidatus Yanofskybacteria bacterium RIFCSPLOWO2_01_FULL_42_49 TaxID=1802694 RepID=A0A1F8GBG4_9BACT|nr:MAG: hypothetical protein A2651_02150 [Candidatus Yanofskybacteria bacterium RIFCSPHIGHO2_01_FULL_42_12]OGN22673.1 MAG: hypothetical protein A2918_01060 [Candidatus Yanofskybacteria bacterium RIFCSPLOWO2_01_FULL_42_49]